MLTPVLALCMPPLLLLAPPSSASQMVKNQMDDKLLIYHGGKWKGKSLLCKLTPPPLMDK